MSDPFAQLVDALHAYLDAGGDPDTMLDTARMVADQHAEEDDDDDC